MQHEIQQTSNVESSKVHPDSGYDNWTVRSYDVTTKMEDIPKWMKMYAESSIDTHEFFKFERFEYKELDTWQKMLLKLYRKDLRKVITYYEEYRESLVREIMARTKSEAEKVVEEEDTRHSVCQDSQPNQKGSVALSEISLQMEGDFSRLLAAEPRPASAPAPSLLVDSPTASPATSPATSPTTSPTASVSSQVVFKRFSNPRPRRVSRQHNVEDMVTAITDTERKTSAADSSALHEQTHAETDEQGEKPGTHEWNTVPETPAITTETGVFKTVGSAVSADPPSPAVSPAPAVSPSSPVVSPHLSASQHSIASSGFESPKLDRSGGKRKIRGKLRPGLFDENVDHNNTPSHDFPSPRHFRSASSRPPQADFPSPQHVRSKSDRPGSQRYSALYTSIFGSGSVASYNSDDSAPKLGGSSGGKSKKLSKLLSRATSFGKRDKNKVERPGDARPDSRPNGKARRDVLPNVPKETSV